MFKARVLSASILALILTACSNQPPPPDGGHIPMSMTTKGAILGGVAGGGIGSIGRSAGATVAGAAAGAALGAIIGHQIDKEHAVKISQHQTGVKLVQSDDKSTLIMPSDIYFGPGDAQIRREYYPMLNDLVSLLKNNPDLNIEVIGYTDSVGEAYNNKELGKIRADNVSAYLESQGINPRSINSISRGKSSPQASNGTAQGREENRRVEIKLWLVR